MNTAKPVVIINLLFLFLFLSLSYAQHAMGAPITWTNGGSDGKASNPNNWSSSITPQDGDEVLFDGTSTDNCEWDLTVTLSGMSITAGYTGTVNLSSELLTIAESSIWIGGLIIFHQQHLTGQITKFPIVEMPYYLMKIH